MILLPFCSDQFNVARDVEDQSLARVLDPNHFSESEMAEAARVTLEAENPALLSWSRWVRDRGPAYAVRRLEQILADRSREMSDGG